MNQSTTPFDGQPEVAINVEEDVVRATFGALSLDMTYQAASALQARLADKMAALAKLTISDNYLG